MNLLKKALWAASVFIALNTSAEIISVDDYFYGPDSITKDSVSGLEWLDVNLSLGRSFLEISSQFGSNGDFEGFRYASVSDFNILFDNIVQSAGNNSGLTKDDIGLVGSSVDRYIEMLGVTGLMIGRAGVVSGIIPVNHLNYLSQVGIYEVEGTQQFGGPRFTGGSIYMSQSNPYIGSWLIRDTTVVDAPSSFILFFFTLMAFCVGRSRIALFLKKRSMSRLFRNF